MSTRIVSRLLLFLVTVSSPLGASAAPEESESTPKVQLQLRDMMKGNEERSMISIACLKSSAAALEAKEAGQLGSVTNQAAKYRRTGSSDDPYVKAIVDRYKLDPAQNFLFAALMNAQADIAWLEEKRRYSPGTESFFMGYLAASCAQLATVQ